MPREKAYFNSSVVILIGFMCDMAKRNRNKETDSSYDVAFLLLKFSLNTVMGARQNLETHLGVEQQPELEKVQEELLFFYCFALDYWLSQLVNTQQERRRTIREGLRYHWQEFAGYDEKSQTILCTLQERLNAYSLIVNEEKSDEVKLLELGTKLSELCGLPRNIYLLILARDLFTEATELVIQVLRE